MTYLFSNKSLKISGLVISLCIFAISFVSSISFGQTPITFETVADAFLNYNQASTEHIIIRTTRVSRAVIATVIGASLALSGALMQALTRNPLASPSIFGINAGALFFIVFSATYFSVSSLVHYMWIAFLGAAVAGILVYFLGSLGRDGLSPVRIVLAGAAITALFVSFTQGLLVINRQALSSILFWLSGSVAGRTMDMLKPLLPFMVGASILALFLGNHVNILMSGDDIAKGLGQRTILIKILIGIVVIFLAGGSVAVAGSIGFIGLIVPHIARTLVGNDYRWVLPYSMSLGASLLLVADVAARFIIMPQEVPIGVMTAFIGTPFFIYVARRGFNNHG
ncbi:ABC-type Fe3+-siderophore transport system, permease component [Halobacteroides halobius DSM 5150]|uniref:ABC-type Fe3+-siderophore transport system, permease component n=1 Tax=Halobacteroides halobius (strain ATCC 35273 / DSM 5150 / MD-1) TaxID=748449 RepID=L0KDP3_HALHC|nr:iron ABC transporter permease [Halobacteroides halobius]AGB42203.1 ABC-type Fe3+-siderophore transport system, permease component [Halobacteroides halobius DSM 5150]